MNNILQKLLKKLVYVQIAALIVGKIMFGIIQMPYTKSQLDISHVPFLMVMLIFYSLNIVIKFYRNKRQLFSRLIIKIQLQCFLLWVITFLGVVFEWGLCDQMNWSLFEKISSALGQLLQTFLFSLIMHPKLISKIQFIGYQALLATSVIGLGIKTVQFVAYNQQALYKDIVVLNLTTQIALSIILMDVAQRSYSKARSIKPQDQNNQNSNNTQIQQRVPADGNTSRLQAEMVMQQEK